MRQTAKKTSEYDNIYRTGFDALDDINGGFKSGELVLLGSRPAIGKTALVYSIINHVCGYERKQCILFSHESINTVIKSLVKQKIGWFESSENNDRYIDAKREVESFNLSIWDAAMDASDIIRRCIGVHPYHKLIIIDYIQLACCCHPGNRRHEINETLWALKAFALNNECTFLITSSISRGVEARKDHKPKVKDLSMFMDIDRGIDLILMLYRNIYDEGEDDYAELAVFDAQTYQKKGVVVLSYEADKRCFFGINEGGFHG